MWPEPWVLVQTSEAPVCSAGKNPCDVALLAEEEVRVGYAGPLGAASNQNLPRAGQKSQEKLAHQEGQIGRRS